jgi:5'-3' exonuclease
MEGLVTRGHPNPIRLEEPGAPRRIIPLVNSTPRLAIFDGHGIIHRAYFALKDQPLVARRTGENTSGVFGFTNTLLSVIDDLKPTHLVVAMDLPGPTFRHLNDPTYNANRFQNLRTSVLHSLAAVPDISDSVRIDIAEAVASANRRDEIKERLFAKTDEVGIEPDLKVEIERALGPFEVQWDIGHQIERCLEMMDAFHIPVYSAQGYEADDVIGTLSKQANAQGIETYIVTLDTDLVQLIEDNVTIYMMRPYQRDHVLYNDASAREHYGFDPHRMPDFKALQGDTSDNIPGIPGVGKGTATKLLVSYGSIDGIYEHLPEVKPQSPRPPRPVPRSGPPRPRYGDHRDLRP